MTRPPFRRFRPSLASLGAGALALLLPLLPGEAEADVYTYKDASGVVHVVSKPPPGIQATRYGGKGKGKAALKSQDGEASAAGVPDRSPDRFSRYDGWIRQASALYQIPEELVRAVIKVESNFDPRAVSHAGAQGLMQLMPETALRMQVRDSFDPRENIFGGTRYLRFLANSFHGSLELTVAGYNAGEGAVARYGGIPPYAETQNYVVQVISHYRRMQAERLTR